MTAEQELRNKFLIHIGLFVAVVGVLGGATWILRGVIHERAETAVRLREQLRSTAENLRSFTQLKEAQQQAQRYEALIQRAFPERDEVLSFSKTFTAIAASHDLTSTFSIVSETKPTGSEPGRAGFTLTLTGPFDGITGFLDEVARNGYFVAFRSITVVSGEGGYKATLGGDILIR
ncbi:hypothetical protein HY417_03870 [Candidatus Kaiserbacteria bacterium]|nr:hypothetical protein [Candidatus Kaiserbacteria bacterium]